MASFSRMLTALVVLVGIQTIASPVRAQSNDSLTRLRETLKHEPKARDVVRMALDYYRVSPEAMQSVRASARTRALMPVVSGFLGYNAAGGQSNQQTTITSPTNVVINQAAATTLFTGGLAWDLRELVFNSAEVQTYAMVPMQKDIMLEVVRTYFLRRQLQIRLALKPPTDPMALATLEIRVEEYTGILDAMTGGSFMRATAPQPE